MRPLLNVQQAVVCFFELEEEGADILPLSQSEGSDDDPSFVLDEER